MIVYHLCIHLLIINHLSQGIKSNFFDERKPNVEINILHFRIPMRSTPFDLLKIYFLLVFVNALSISLQSFGKSQPDLFWLSVPWHTYN